METVYDAPRDVYGLTVELSHGTLTFPAVYSNLIQDVDILGVLTTQTRQCALIIVGSSVM